MANIYNTMIEALREHWKAHEGAYPQAFELSEELHRLLNETRKTVVTTMNYKFRPGWEGDFLGVKVVVTGGPSCMVDKAGSRVPLAV